MSSFSIDKIKYEDTGKRTDDNSWWRKTFGDNTLGKYWGKPIVKLTEDLTFYLGPLDKPFYTKTIEKGFVCDLGTNPGLFGSVVKLLVGLKLIPENTERSAVLHDLLWAEADKAGGDTYTVYKLADEIFLNAMISEGQPIWFSLIVFGIVRFVANLKIFGRWIISKIRK